MLNRVKAYCWIAANESCRSSSDAPHLLQFLSHWVGISLVRGGLVLGGSPISRYDDITYGYLSHLNSIPNWPAPRRWKTGYDLGVSIIFFRRRSCNCWRSEKFSEISPGLRIEQYAEEKQWSIEEQVVCFPSWISNRIASTRKTATVPRLILHQFSVFSRYLEICRLQLWTL